MSIATPRSPYPLVPLGEILSKSEEWVDILPDQQYRQVTIKMNGLGVVQRNEVAGAEIAASRRLRVRAGQFILSRIDARNGALGIVPPELEGAVVSNDFPAFDVSAERVLPAFLGWMSRTRDFVELCRAASEGTTNRVRLQEDRFLSLTIPLPPLAEQRRVVARVEAVAARVAEAKRLRGEASETDLQKMLLSAYQSISRDAPRVPLEAVAPLTRRPVEVSIEDSYHELGVRSFGKGTFHKPAIKGAEVGTKRLFQLNPGDLVFNNVFAWEGAIAVVRPEDSGRVGSHRFITCVAQPGRATASFLCFHFLTEEGLQQIGDASPGGAGRNRTLGLESLTRIPVPVPPYERQMWFAGLTAKVAELRALQAETAAELDALLPGVLDRAFRGEL
jgi:type I restriction enzyme, S subunit